MPPLLLFLKRNKLIARRHGTLDGEFSNPMIGPLNANFLWKEKLFTSHTFFQLSDLLLTACGLIFSCSGDGDKEC